VTAEEIMRDDPSNQVRIMLEEDLFELSNQIILRDAVEISEDEVGEPFVRRKLNRRLIIESATLASVDSASDVCKFRLSLPHLAHNSSLNSPSRASLPT